MHPTVTNEICEEAREGGCSFLVRLSNGSKKLTFRTPRPPSVGNNEDICPIRWQTMASRYGRTKGSSSTKGKWVLGLIEKLFGVRKGGGPQHLAQLSPIA
eukprot:scaffold212_cov384-Pavlova_lutheri.AAC.3